MQDTNLTVADEFQRGSYFVESRFEYGKFHPRCKCGMVRYASSLCQLLPLRETAAFVPQVINAEMDPLQPGEDAMPQNA